MGKPQKEEGKGGERDKMRDLKRALVAFLKREQEEDENDRKGDKKADRKAERKTRNLKMTTSSQPDFLTSLFLTLALARNAKWEKKKREDPRETGNQRETRNQRETGKMMTMM